MGYAVRLVDMVQVFSGYARTDLQGLVLASQTRNVEFCTCAHHGAEEAGSRGD